MMILSVLSGLLLIVGIVLITWPALIILGRYADDPQNYLAGFILGVTAIVIWWFL